MTIETPTAATSAPAATDASTSATSLPTADPAAQAPGSAAPAAPQGEPTAASSTEKPADPNAEKQGAPEKYEFKQPDDIKFDDEVLTEFSAFAKEKNLSQEDAQKFADFGIKAVQKTRDAFQRKVDEAHAQWVSESRADPEFGGDKLAENMAIAKRAIDAFGSPKLVELLNASGLGDHPEVVRAFYRMGKAVSEDKTIRASTAPTGDSKSLAQQLYPNMNP